MINKTNAIREFIILIIITIFAWLVLAEFDAFEEMIEYLESHEEYELDELVLLLIVFGVFSIFYSLRRVNEASKINQHLKELNENLEKKVEFAVKEQREQEYILIQQSKHIAMGEMISNIAHQWRQPLNALGLVLQNLKFSYEMDELDDEFMDNSLKKSNMLIGTMSKTIDDFRNFFKPNKIKEEFSLNDTISQSSALIGSSFGHHDITLKKELPKDINLFGYPNELSQALVNILNNAKDELLKHTDKERVVSISTHIDKLKCVIEIFNNGDKIKEDVIGKIFDPYFTTKDDEKGTGIGLYMTKTIIEKNMSGQLTVKNVDDGVVFIISLPIN